MKVILETVDTNQVLYSEFHSTGANQYFMTLIQSETVHFFLKVFRKSTVAIANVAPALTEPLLTVGYTGSIKRCKFHK